MFSAQTRFLSTCDKQVAMNSTYPYCIRSRNDYPSNKQIIQTNGLTQTDACRSGNEGVICIHTGIAQQWVVLKASFIVCLWISHPEYLVLLIWRKPNIWKKKCHYFFEENGNISFFVITKFYHEARHIVFLPSKPKLSTFHKHLS